MRSRRRGSDVAATVSPSSIESKHNTPSNAFHASRIPDVETWHRRLGHCNVGAIVDMARKHTVEGMTINLSSSPAKCDACIRGKQTRSPVSKVREGETDFLTNLGGQEGWPIRFRLTLRHGRIFGQDCYGPAVPR